MKKMCRQSSEICFYAVRAVRKGLFCAFLSVVAFLLLKIKFLLLKLKLY